MYHMKAYDQNYQEQAAYHEYQMSLEMQDNLANLCKQFQSERRNYKLRLYQSISCLTLKMQFIHLMNDWAQQQRQCILSFRYIANGGDFELNRKQQLQLPLGLWIESSASNKWYLNQGVCAKTLQGFMYFGVEWKDEFIEKVRDNNGDFSVLLLEIPNVAIKFYDKQSVDECTTLSNGSQIRENAIMEMQMLEFVCKTDGTNENGNIIRLVDHWLDADRNCYFMVTEWANCGELLVLIDSFHRSVYEIRNKFIPKSMDGLHGITISQIQNSLELSRDGENAYIELCRYLFQSMVFAVNALHKQGICHLDLSMENWVIHFDEKGILSAKLIDFGRAKQFPLILNDKNEQNKYDFSYNVFPGKCRYMSPEAAMCLKYRNCQYNANEQDIWSLAIVLFCMLTCSLPYDRPFATVHLRNGDCLNGDCKYMIRDKDLSDLDENFSAILNFGVKSLLFDKCMIDYVTPQSLDLLSKILILDSNSRLNMDAIMCHPFVSTRPDPSKLCFILKSLIDSKQKEFEQRRTMIADKNENAKNLYKQRFEIKAKKHLLSQINNKNNNNKVNQTSDQTSDDNAQTNVNESIENVAQTSNEKSGLVQSAMSEEHRELLSTITTDVFVLNRLNALNLEINVTQFLASPSPPPCAMYACSSQYSDNTLTWEDVSDCSSENHEKHVHSFDVSSHLNRHFVNH